MNHRRLRKKIIWRRYLRMSRHIQQVQFHSSMLPLCPPLNYFLDVPYEMPRPRSSKTLPPYRPPPYQFASPYIADHIIREDAMFHGNKIFVPPVHATYEETRHTDIRAEMPVPLMGRCSPPLDPTTIALDNLKNHSNFDPPISFVCFLSLSFIIY